MAVKRSNYTPTKLDYPYRSLAYLIEQGRDHTSIRLDIPYRPIWRIRSSERGEAGTTGGRVLSCTVMKGAPYKGTPAVVAAGVERWREGRGKPQRMTKQRRQNTTSEPAERQPANNPKNAPSGPAARRKAIRAAIKATGAPKTITRVWNVLADRCVFAGDGWGEASYGVLARDAHASERSARYAVKYGAAIGLFAVACGRPRGGAVGTSRTGTSSRSTATTRAPSNRSRNGARG